MCTWTLEGQGRLFFILLMYSGLSTSLYLYKRGSGTYHAVGAWNRVTGFTIWRMSARHVGKGFSLNQKRPTLHHSECLDYCFTSWFCSAGLECSHSAWRINGEVANIKQWHDVKQPKNKTNMPLNPSNPPFVPSIISSETLYSGESDGSSSVKKKLFSFSANRTEADRRYEVNEPSWFDATHLGRSLGDDMISLSLQPSASSNQSP